MLLNSPSTNDLDAIVQCLRSGQIVQATRLLTQRLAFQPSCGEALALLGMVFFLVNDFGYAERLLRRALQHEPMQTTTLAVLAVVLHRTGHRAEAQELLRCAVQGMPQAGAARVRVVGLVSDLRCFARAFAQHRRRLWA